VRKCILSCRQCTIWNDCRLPSLLFGNYLLCTFRNQNFAFNFIPLFDAVVYIFLLKPQRPCSSNALYIVYILFLFYSNGYSIIFLKCLVITEGLKIYISPYWLQPLVITLLELIPVLAHTVNRLLISGNLSVSSEDSKHSEE
jgi:hypothetical protein